MTSLLKQIAKVISSLVYYSGDFPKKYELITTINLLNNDEKCFLVQVFLDTEWNVGSIKILSILQECLLLTATEYILSQNDEKHIQLVLYDFLEAEYTLLAQVIKNVYYNHTCNLRLKSHLEDCFRQLVCDIIENPNIVNLQYLYSLKNLLQEQIYQKVLSMHLNFLLKRENISTLDCFINAKEFQDSVQNNQTLLKLIQIIIDADQVFVLNELFQLSTLTKFKGWKYLLIVFGVMSKSQNYSVESLQLIKKYLKNMFNTFVTEMNKELCFAMFAVARVIFNIEQLQKNSSNSVIETYNSWFKNTIGNMKYTLSAEKFKYVMSVLFEMIEYDCDQSSIQIHINTAIIPAIYCNDLVLSYKELCRNRISFLTQKNVPDTDEKNAIENEDKFI